MSTLLKPFKNCDFKTFDYSKDRMYEVENDIDPEINFFHTVHSDFKDHTEQQFNVNIRMAGVLLYRSLNRNFSAIHDYFRQFKNKFSVIAVSETWFNEDSNIDFGIHGYEMFSINRRNKKKVGLWPYMLILLLNINNYKLCQKE